MLFFQIHLLKKMYRHRDWILPLTQKDPEKKLPGYFSPDFWNFKEACFLASGDNALCLFDIETPQYVSEFRACCQKVTQKSETVLAISITYFKPERENSDFFYLGPGTALTEVMEHDNIFAMMVYLPRRIATELFFCGYFKTSEDEEDDQDEEYEDVLDQTDGDKKIDQNEQKDEIDISFTPGFDDMLIHEREQDKTDNETFTIEEDDKENVNPNVGNKKKICTIIKMPCSV